MPRDPGIRSVLVLGSGPIQIGQGCEFDYSGTQAVKALRQEGCRVVLVNSNPATIMTDPDLADATYIEPLDPEIVARIVEKERPDSCLPTVGGQTAINLAMELERRGVWERFGVRLLGASPRALELAEDRLAFQEAMREAGLAVPRGRVCATLEEAEAAVDEVGLPAVVRPSYTLGGTGGGIAADREALRAIALRGIELSPVGTVLIEESLLGWKEYELEVMRDGADQAVVVCGIENLDPMGIHTGDSITIAPAMTLTDPEYQEMRDDAFRVIRTIGVETGGSNIQFAVHPETRRRVVIEMNPRVSRSSALASKATGFPIAKIAARLALGYRLAEIPNDITRETPACFEPTLDYVVVKIPRWNFEKFPDAAAVLTTEMRSVGEVMAIGRTFREALQKGLRSLEIGLAGFDRPPGFRPGEEGDPDRLRDGLRRAGPERLLLVAEAFRRGMPVGEAAELTAIEPWFLDQIRRLVRMEETIRSWRLSQVSREEMRAAKRDGFSDAAIAGLLDTDEEEVRRTRRMLGLRPVYHRIDTCAGEFASFTPYLYSTYETRCEAAPTCDRKILVLGGGPIRIGQGIEFDACACEASAALAEEKIESILVNCNPETVSTDYDTSDRLYFEPLTVEDLLEIVDREKPDGVILQFGGQTPLRLARPLERAGVAILGTSPDSIDLAEDRLRFGELAADLGIPVPPHAVARSIEEALAVAGRIGYPLMLRPSYVLGGRSMARIYDEAALRAAIASWVLLDDDNPLFLDRFLEGAVEVDVDALCDGQEVWIAGIQQHVEMAGIHSGDSTAVLPPHSIDEALLEAVRESTRRIGARLGAVGLLNIQFALTGGKAYVLEANPRASRTIPYVSKAIGFPLARMATRLLLGARLRDLDLPERAIAPRWFVKMPVFPFRRFPKTDPILGPEMRSTGEVLGIAADLGAAFAKASLASGVRLPRAGTAFLSVNDRDKTRVVEIARSLRESGFRLLATSGTAERLREGAIPCETIPKVNEGSPNVAERIGAGEIDLVINTPLGRASFYDEKPIRSSALERGVPCLTTIEGAREAVAAIRAAAREPLAVESLQEIHPRDRTARGPDAERAERLAPEARTLRPSR
ncbi:MAG: carbamoyl-phosphate synthase large subunit [Candidatus Eisenbacteria bacterium]|nr:carbamoyl-phosphate synthase large subunit [Candidatus Latescibacterota bacterium]MBD3302705.1 carbamoyl-phosphate synthase large subunit [Candidatus Eisenbacteria bacterium]